MLQTWIKPLQMLSRNNKKHMKRFKLHKKRKVTKKSRRKKRGRLRSSQTPQPILKNQNKNIKPTWIKKKQQLRKN